MKPNPLHKFFHPKYVLPAVAIIAIAIGAGVYHLVGRAPTVNVPAPSDTVSSSGAVVSTDGTSTSLAFPIGGRIATVSVKTGDTVSRGQVLATLDGGAAQGALTQAKGALELAQAQYGSMDLQYQNAKKQQDILVENAYRALLSGGLQAVPTMEDDSHIPVISGTYSCDKEGTYDVAPYASGGNSGYSFTVSGLETGFGSVIYSAPQPLGSCGLYIQFSPGFYGATRWTVDVPNTHSSVYVANKNAYDLAVATRDQVLSQFAANLGQNGSSTANVAQAAVDSAQGAYQAALAAYQNTIITSPVSGTVTFVDTDLKVGQAVNANEPVISISAQ